MLSCLLKAKMMRKTLEKLKIDFQITDKIAFVSEILDFAL